MLVGMYDIAIASGGAPTALWTAIAARQAIGQAIEAVESAGAQLSGLIADTHWESDGVRTLRARLTEMQTGTGSTAAQLQVRSWELDRAAGS